MKKRSITKFKLDPKKPPKTDWRAFDAMSDEKRHRAALSDPDCPPASEARLARAPRQGRPSAPNGHCKRPGCRGASARRVACFRLPVSWRSGSGVRRVAQHAPRWHRASHRSATVKQQFASSCGRGAPPTPEPAAAPVGHPPSRSASLLYEAFVSQHFFDCDREIAHSLARCMVNSVCNGGCHRYSCQLAKTLDAQRARFFIEATNE
jgi:hypothetical protein